MQDIATALRIRLQYLEALEAGRINDLPGNAYALGYLRTYAVALGLDPNEVARRIKAEVAAVNEKTRLAFPVPVPERGVPAGAVVLLGVLLAVGAYAGWYRLSGEGRLPAETSTQVPLRLASLADQAVRVTDSPADPGRRAGRTASGAAGRGAAGAGNLPEFGGGCPGPPCRCPADSPASRASCCGRAPMPGCRCGTAPARCC